MQIASFTASNLSYSASFPVQPGVGILYNVVVSASGRSGDKSQSCYIPASSYDCSYVESPGENAGEVCELCYAVTDLCCDIVLDCVVLYTGLRCVIYWTVLCYTLECVVLYTGLCCVIYWSVLCYILDCAVLHTGLSCVIHWTVLCYTLDCIVLYTGLYCVIHWTALCYTLDCVVLLHAL